MIALDSDDASIYNPYSAPSTSFGNPAAAIDGHARTAWTYRLDPTTQGKTHVGLAIALKSPQPVQMLHLVTATPGMTVQFYGATGAQPVSFNDPQWLLLATRRSIDGSTTVPLQTLGESFNHLLIWITHAPSGMTAGTLRISEVSFTD